MSDNPREDCEKRSLKSAFVRSFIFPVIAAVIIVAAFRAWRPERFSRSQNLKTEVETLPVYGQVPDFSLVKTDGKKFTNADLTGKVWIADFIFTHCSGICPLMTGKMSSAAKELELEPEVRFVSFSVDPERDTPEVLAKYAERFNAAPDRWFFLTGDKAQIFKLSNQHFHLGVADVSPEEREALDQSVRHSAKFVLVDREGQIRGYYDSDGPNAGVKLIQDARLLLSKKGNK